MKKTKIVATMGPASQSPQMITKLLKSGVNVFRINCSHATHDDIRTTSRNIRAACKASNMVAAVLLDLQGPKIRVGIFEQGSIELKKGAKLVMEVTDKKSDGSFIPVQYKHFAEDIKPGCNILLEDGKFKLKALSKKGRKVTVKVIDGGILKDKKGINLPDSSISADPVTKKDLADLKIGLAEKVDFVALSFVRKADDILKVKKLIQNASSHAEVISKIERHEALEELDAIIDATDAIMVARGDLGVEISATRIPVIQRQMILKCSQKFKPVIVATQMLESMIDNPRPTRAEISDVGNAVQCYSDAVMLSGETSVGKYPVQCVEQMSMTALEIEQYQKDYHRILPWEQRCRSSFPPHDALAYSAAKLAEMLGAKAIIALTETGDTVKKVSSPHPNIPIFAFSRHPQTVQKLCLVRGVTPFFAKKHKHYSELLREVTSTLKKNKLIKKGDEIVVIAGFKMGVRGGTNLLQIETVK